MSKEKNLTFMETNKLNKIVVNLDGHCCDTYTDDPVEVYSNLDPLKPYATLPGKRYSYVSGPAIDRLHEFEKLGMEPEEIERLKKYYDACSSNVKELSEKLCLKELAYMELEQELKGYRTQQSHFMDCNKDQADEIDRLQKEVTRLNNVIDSQIAVIKSLREKNQRQAENIEGLQGYIKALEQDCEYFKGERNDAFDEIKKLKTKLNKIYGAIGMC